MLNELLLFHYMQGRSGATSQLGSFKPKTDPLSPGPDHWSDIPLVRHPIRPKMNHSIEIPLVRHLITPKKREPLVRRPISPTIHSRDAWMT